MEIRHKVLVARGDQQKLQDIVEGLQRIPRVNVITAATNDDARTFSECSRPPPAFALINDSIGNSLTLCEKLKQISPSTRIYYFPETRSDVEGLPSCIDEIYPNIEYETTAVLGVIDAYLERIEEDPLTRGYMKY